MIDYNDVITYYVISINDLGINGKQNFWMVIPP